MTIKKNDVLVANKAFKVGDNHFNKGQVFLVEKGGKNQVIMTRNEQGVFIGLEGNFDTDGFVKSTIAEVSHCEKAFGNVQVKGITRVDSHDGYSMSANLFVDGKKVGVIENDGWGGETYIIENGKDGKEIVDKLIETAKGIAIQSGVDLENRHAGYAETNLWDYLSEQYYIFESFGDYMRSFQKQVA